jgi:hypothetical protein
MGIASGADIRHFFNAMRSWRSFFYVARRVARHALDAGLHGRGMHLVNGNALVAALYRSALDAGVDMRLNCPAVRLVTEDIDSAGNAVDSPAQHAVRGAVVLQDGKEVPLRARRGVVLATGGFPHDERRKRELLPHDPAGNAHFSAASRGNTGDGLRNNCRGVRHSPHNTNTLW